MNLSEQSRGVDCYLIEVAGEVDLGSIERLRAAIGRGEGHRLVFANLAAARAALPPGEERRP